MLLLFYEPSGKGKLAHYTLKLSMELLNLSEHWTGFTKTKPEIMIITSKNYELFKELSEKRNKREISLKILPVFSSQHLKIFEIFRFIMLVGREKPDIIHFQYPPSPLSLVFFLFFLKIRALFANELSLFYTAHNALPHSKKLYGYFFYKIFLRNMQKVIVHSEDDRRVIENLGIEKDKIAVIEHGVVFDKPGISKLQARKKLGIGKGKENKKSKGREIIFLFFGYISEKKGICELLQAFKNAYEEIESKGKVIKLVIAGTESKGFDIKREIEALGIEKHAFEEKGKKEESRVYIDIGYINKKKAELYFKACDVLILPYRKEKHSPLVQVAYYFGMPVIASDKQMERVIDGKTGYIFRAGSIRELKNAIIKISDEGNLDKLSKNALKESRKYSWKKIAEKTINTYFTS